MARVSRRRRRNRPRGASTVGRLEAVSIRARSSDAELFGDVRGRVVYHEDILAPTTEEWPET